MRRGSYQKVENVPTPKLTPPTFCQLLLFHLLTEQDRQSFEDRDWTIRVSECMIRVYNTFMSDGC
ncbi:MAG: hypothetical protein ACRC10_04185 [Thermoguttaceae bacterium]